MNILLLRSPSRLGLKSGVLYLKIFPHLHERNYWLNSTQDLALINLLIPGMGHSNAEAHV